MEFYPSLIQFPGMLMRDRSITWEISSRTISGGQTLAGVMPIGRLDGGGLWSCSMDGVQLSSADQVRTWRALAAQLDGGVTPVVVPYRDVRFAPFASTETDLLVATHTDDSTMSDGSTYVSARIDAEVAADASLRATTLVLVLNVGAALRGGEHLSIEHESFSHRMYRVASVSINDAGQSVCTIRPPLREAVTAGALVEFDYPKCVMRLASPDAMDLALERRFHGSASVRLVEAMPPFDT